MSNKRKDNRGRVLRTGESQRKDGTYDYRYTDVQNNRCSVYAPTLEELRQKETEIQRMKSDGVSYTAGDITVLELLERYINMKQRAVRYTTRSGYKFVQSVVAKYDFGDRKIRSIKMSDAKLWLIELYDDGYSWNSIASIRGVVKPAFQMAFTEELIRRNPFDFRLDIIPNDTEKRVALTQRQQRDFLNFIAEDKHYS